jgi:hypothetical protein
VIQSEPRVNRVEKVLADGGVDPVVFAANIRGVELRVKIISKGPIKLMAEPCQLTFSSEVFGL